jgi:potassium-transporting ATPase KdpC subunit
VILSIMMSALRASLVTWLLCGLIYPLALTGLGQRIFPFQANGSLEKSPAGIVIGSRLIGQQWSGSAWFHGRPSATMASDPNDPAKIVPAPYNAASSAGSNLGPTSLTLMNRLARDRKSLERAQPELAGRLVSSDMLTASASGLDPDISPANAALQVERVARVRGVPEASIKALLSRYITGRSLGIFGEPRVNVLALNLALQRAYPKR